MVIGCIVGLIVVSSLIFIFIYAVRIARRDDRKIEEAEEVKNKPDEVKNKPDEVKNKPDEVEADSNKDTIFDVEYDENCKKLIKQYGKCVFESVAVRRYLLDLKTTPLYDKVETYAEWCRSNQYVIEFSLREQQEKKKRVRYANSLFTKYPYLWPSRAEFKESEIELIELNEY